MDLLITYIHYTEQQTITARLLISTIHRSPQYLPSLNTARCVFNSRSLEMTSYSGDYSASRAHIVTVRRTSLSLTLVNCQPKYSAICSQLNSQSSTQLPNLNRTHSLTHQLLHFTSLHFTSLHFTSLHFTSLHFTSLHFTQPTWSPRYIAPWWTQQNTVLLFSRACSFPRELVYRAVA
jgi:hypothetical protein